jgi:hypothetical protein
MPVFSNVSHRPLFAFPDRLTAVTVRLVAGGVSLAIVTACLLKLGWALPLLALGFALRVAAGPRLSLLARMAIMATRLLRLPTQTTAGAPKQLAAAIGAATLIAASLLWWFGLSTAGWAIAGVVAVLAGLEAAFGFCLGCRLYAALFGCADCQRSSG